MVGPAVSQDAGNIFWVVLLLLQKLLLLLCSGCWLLFITAASINCYQAFWLLDKLMVFAKVLYDNAVHWWLYQQQELL
jgi:uncharacterized membrane protein SirB2